MIVALSRFKLVYIHGWSETSLDFEQVHRIFKKLETKNGADSFTHVAYDVEWIVEGTHPLAGH